MVLIRLQKFLSSAGVCSRRHAEEYIKSGRIKVNDEVITQLGTKVDPEIDQIALDETPIKTKPNLIYIALNKPKGYVTSCEQSGDKIVLDLIHIPERVYPVGRLDKDSTGLLILTNDGRIHHRLSHPSYEHEKEYEVTVIKPITDGALLKMAKGLPMMGKKTRPALIHRVSSKCFRIILKEGRNRQVRRMVRKVGNRVSVLKRLRISNIKLGSLREGSWRYLSEMEIKDLTAS